MENQQLPSPTETSVHLEAARSPSGQAESEGAVTEAGPAAVSAAPAWTPAPGAVALAGSSLSVPALCLAPHFEDPLPS